MRQIDLGTGDCGLARSLALLCWFSLKWRRDVLRLCRFRSFGAGIFQALGSIDPMMDKQRKKLLPCAADHRLDEPAKLSLSMVASPQCPLPFRPARPL